jgi:GcrA cell cycle regulator
MRKVGFEDIGEGACRWPLGDPTGEDFVYCGVETAKGRSYCAGHCRMAYKPPNARVWDGQRYVAVESLAAA